MLDWLTKLLGRAPKRKVSAYLLDWRGTLNKLDDPYGFVQALNDRGDITIMYSGGPPPGEKALYNKVAGICQFYSGKGNIRQEVESLVGVHVYTSHGIKPPDEVVICDDYPPDEDYIDSILRPMVPVRVVAPKDMLAELAP